MIEWLRNKFASIISACFVLYVVLVTTTGAIYGYMIGKAIGTYSDNYSGIGLVMGIIIGLPIGVLTGILFFGLIATIIHISESNDALQERFNLIHKEIKEIHVTAFQAQTQNNSMPTSIAEVQPQTQNTPSPTSNNEPGTWICPKCGIKNSVESKSCNSCGQFIWICPYCREANPIGTIICKKCGKR